MSDRQLEDARGFWPDLSFGEARDVAQSPTELTIERVTTTASALGLVLLARIAEAMARLVDPPTEAE